MFIPQEGVLSKEVREWCSDGAKILDEAAVVTHQAEEATEAMCGAWLRLGRHRVHLVPIHGHAVGGDHVAKIGHGGKGEGAFAALDA